MAGVHGWIVKIVVGILYNGYGSGQYQPDTMTLSARATYGGRLHNAVCHSVSGQLNL